MLTLKEKERNRKAQAMSHIKNPLGTNYKGGIKYHSAGYVLIIKKDHPRAKSNKGYVYEHIVVIEKLLGRFLNPRERVHHINGKKDDNSVENLKVMDVSDHARLHHPKKIVFRSNINHILTSQA